MSDIVWAENGRENLKKLADYVMKNRTNLPMDFDMEYFCIAKNQMDEIGPENSLNVCDTSGCFLGHAPHAGIRTEFDESWDDYGARLFIDMYKNSANDRAWEWVFGSVWAGIDNTPVGAALRAYWLLEEREVNGSYATDYLNPEFADKYTPGAVA